MSAMSLSGGQGKSSTILFTAKMLAEAGYTVLAVDADPQGNLSTFLQHDLQPNEPTLLEVVKGSVALEDGIYPVKDYDRLFLIPADDALEGLQDYLSTSGIGALMMKQRLEPAKGNFDICLIDPPPQRFQLSRSVIGASEQIIIPVELNVKGFGSLIRTTAAIQEFIEFKICHPEILGVLPFRDRWTGLNRTIECETWLNHMQGEIAPELFLPSLRESTKVVRAISSGLPLSALTSPEDKYPLDEPFKELLKRVTSKMEKHSNV
ncbi:MAG: ParA family protein [Drouetiella hepatica Uher 2000/2452]|uniref:ParA family protein n=1 Tax=Drouetiella hepatica Uher 2000/2452 TaxID=904376 RepID=A0A951QE55_9CYAN|nr:ParA family protein [Drouetiella hepatica Uher 2000/2452]